MSLFIAVLLASAQTTATQPAAPAVPASTEPAPKAKKVCKLDESSGSHMVKRICLTEQEWTDKNRNGVESTRYGISGKAQDH